MNLSTVLFREGKNLDACLEMCYHMGSTDFDRLHQFSLFFERDDDRCCWIDRRTGKRVDDRDFEKLRLEDHNLYGDERGIRMQDLMDKFDRHKQRQPESFYDNYGDEEEDYFGFGGEFGYGGQGFDSGYGGESGIYGSSGRGRQGEDDMVSE